MTTDEAKIQIEYRKDFATPAQIEALDMALNALDEVEKYKKVIEEIKADIEPYEYEDKYESVKDDMTGWVLAIDVVKVIDKHIKGVES